MPDNRAFDERVSQSSGKSRRAFLLGSLVTAVSGLSLFAALRRRESQAALPAEPASESATFLGPFAQNRSIKTADPLSWVSGLSLSMRDFGGRGKISVTFWRTGTPQSVGTLRVTLIGFDSAGERILDKNQLCFDMRGAEQAAKAESYGFLLGNHQSEFYVPVEMLPDLSKIKVILERTPSSLSA